MPLQPWKRMSQPLTWPQPEKQTASVGPSFLSQHLACLLSSDFCSLTSIFSSSSENWRPSCTCCRPISLPASAGGTVGSRSPSGTSTHDRWSTSKPLLKPSANGNSVSIRGAVEAAPNASWLSSSTVFPRKVVVPSTENGSSNEPFEAFCATRAPSSASGSWSRWKRPAQIKVLSKQPHLRSSKRSAPMQRRARGS